MDIPGRHMVFHAFPGTMEIIVLKHDLGMLLSLEALQTKHKKPTDITIGTVHEDLRTVDLVYIVEFGPLIRRNRIRRQRILRRMLAVRIAKGGNILFKKRNHLFDGVLLLLGSC
jgi:hypothetical protein